MRRILLAFVLLMAIGLAAETQSQGPPPSSGDAQGKHEADPAQEHGNRQTNERGTPEAPFVIHTQPQKQNRIATKPKHEGGWYASPDWWIAGFTGALFVVTAGLWLFTGLMWRTTRDVAQAARDSIKLAREEFNTTHRPEIIVRFTEASHDTTDAGETIGANITIVNKGTADAAVEKINGRIFPGVSYIRPGINADDLKLVPRTLFPGEDWTGIAIFSSANDANLIDDGIRLWCVGEIDYADKARRKRRTGFCRTYDRKTKTWQRQENPDYEYSY